jgi:hypothetical protein
MERDMQRLWSIVAVAVLPAILAAGCDSLQPPERTVSQNPGDYAGERLPGITMAAARQAAVSVLKSHFRLDSDASNGAVIRSRPQDSTGRGDSEAPRVGEVLTGRGGRHREIAEIQLAERGNDIMARCQVRVQRLDTAQRRAFAMQRGGDDRPSEMPTNQSPAVSSRAPEEWVNVGRNRELERTILNQIAESLAGQIAASRPK